ncbi:MAG TPA: hypothetical protein VM489_06225 [Burkholderiales bacterium]|nr:hypothetical protein [Burkholderiales bacterium]
MTALRKQGTSLFFLLWLFLLPAAAQACKVVDPELQGSYRGPCVNGLAEGEGEAVGTARYRGGFRAGLKHGRGVKEWPSGDRYEGEWADDRRHGAGVYTWGRGRWAGERYEGGYREDRRHGFGVYRWPSGDVYAGPWEDDRIAGPPTPMMLARAKFEAEARAAVAKEGQRVCRFMPVGIGGGEWVRGTVAGVSGEQVGVRIDEAGSHPHVAAGVELRAGEVFWDLPTEWTPCY